MNGREAFVRLMRGNEKYQRTDKSEIDASVYRRRELLDNGQHPMAAVVCCSDSRVVPEAIFSVDIGDIFVIRIPGNVVAANELGAIEYAVGHLHVPLVFVLGHTGCGAIGATISGEAEGFITALTSEVKRAIGDETDPMEATKKNVSYVVEKIKHAASRFHGEQRKLVLCGGIYHQDSGMVEVVA